MSRRGFWLRHTVWPAALFMLAAALVSLGQVDFKVGDFFFDASLDAFPGRTLDWLEALHRGGRLLAASVGGGALLLGGVGLALGRWHKLRRGALYVGLCFLLGPGLVALGKQATNVDCPWDLTRYGGERPYVALLEQRPADIPAGKCFPSGHSSGAFAFFAFYFLLRRHRPALAPAALAGTLALGLLYALTQWARGAHFPSHDIASAAVCWYTSLGLAALCLRRRPVALQQYLRAGFVR